MIKNNNNKLNNFKKFIAFHNKLKDKRHIQGDKIYSDYDTLAGIGLIIIIISLFSTNVYLFILGLTSAILFFVLNNTEITPKNKG